MPRRSFEFDPPDRFVAGAIGEPGQRTFYLQARQGRRVVSVTLEKVQVTALAKRLGLLLVELDRRGIAKETATSPAPDIAPLDEPLNEVFRAGTLTLGWDGERGRVLVEARETQPDDPDAAVETEEVEALDDDEDGPDVVRVRMSAETARSFVERALRIVRAGRPPCPFCGNPLDPGGHICPRKNGHFIN